MVRRCLMVPLLASLVLLGCGNRPPSKPPPAACAPGCANCGPDGKCTDCTPGRNLCQGDFVVACRPDGTIGATVQVCDPAANQKCAGGACIGPCEMAAAARSYIGCDYWPTTTLSAQLNPYFDFAVAVANPLKVGDVVTNGPAHVTVTRGSDKIAEADVAPGAVETIKLPWIAEVSMNQLQEQSAQVDDGAYHLVSTLPVTVYQFSPLQFEKPQSKECKDPLPLNNTCHSYTNDASILLPSTALRADYLVIARQTYALTTTDPVTKRTTTNATPGFFTVVATQDNTNVTVKYSAFTGSGTNLLAHAPGESETYALNKGGVLQIISRRDAMPCAKTAKDAQGTYCDLGPKYDLTGSRITADKPIAVFGGHSCSFVPFDKWACDHLEEQLFPVETWGKTGLAVATEPQSKNEPNLFRVISGSDKNQITFDPPTVQKPVTLNAGQYVEFVAQGAFQAKGTGRVAIAVYMVGQNFTGDFNQEVGDPSFGLAAPVEQYRATYDFLTPATYTKSYLNLIIPKGAKLVLDGRDVGAPVSPIGASGFSSLRLEVPPGAHNISSQGPDVKFGIMVSGIANFTSYLYAGGLNLNEVELQ